LLLAVTANAILTGEINGQKTFSVYFGQTFEKTFVETEKSAASRVNFGGQQVYEISSVSDLDAVPNSFEISDLVNAFDSHFHDGVSNVRVYRIINLVYILRKLITRSNVRRSPSLITNLI
jgi:hypothetical protein